MPQTARQLGDTIVAAATPAGVGAIAVVRVSGPEARQILRDLAPRRRASPPRELRVADLVDGEGALLDRAMVVEMLQPHSYTGEDIFEAHLHGSVSVVHAVIDRILALGARTAQPGEFSLRAFLNGKMTLAAAEAISDMIVSSNNVQRRVAARHLSGGLSALVGALCDGLEGVLAEVTAACDFPEDVALSALGDGHVAFLREARGNISRLISGARLGLGEPRRVVLCGAANVGKSTLANAIAGEKRVIVDAEPGTTRDPVEISVSTETTSWVLVDTAGIRNDATGVEAQGVEMSLARIRGADVSVWLVDPQAPVFPDVSLGVDHLVGSKADLADLARRGAVEALARERGFAIEKWLCGLAPGGPEAVRRELGELVAGAPSLDEIVVVRLRHVEALREAEAALDAILDGDARGAPLDLVAIELDRAAGALGTILGRKVDAEVLDKIFASFCLGK